VGWFDERPKDAGELLKLLRSLSAPKEVLEVQPVVESKPTPKADPARQENLLGQLRELQQQHEDVVQRKRRTAHWRNIRNGVLVFVATMILLSGALFGVDEWVQIKFPWLAIVLIALTTAIAAAFSCVFIFPAEEQ
jgi:hypothetical protein